MYKWENKNIHLTVKYTFIELQNDGIELMY